MCLNHFDLFQERLGFNLMYFEKFCGGLNDGFVSFWWLNTPLLPPLNVYELFMEAKDCPFINLRQEMKKFYVTSLHSMRLKLNKLMQRFLDIQARLFCS